MKYFSALFFSCAALGLAACSAPETPPPPPQATVHGSEVHFPHRKDPVDLRVAEVAAASERPLVLPGRLVWDEDVTARVFAPFAGRIDRIRVQQGQTIAAGTPLVSLLSAEVGQAQADGQRAHADAVQARRHMERLRGLFEVGAVAARELEAAEADHLRAQAEWQRARSRLAPYGQRVGDDGSVGWNAPQELVLSSPVAGVVVERNLTPGLEVRPDSGTPLVVVSDPRRLWVQVDVDETHLARVQMGARMVLTTAAWPRERFEATVDQVAPVVDPQSRTIKVRARVANPKGQLRAEMFVQAQVDTHDGLPLVPADAVFVRGQQLGVFVALGEGRYQRRFVQLRSAGPQWWHVEQGLQAGEKVVIGGALFLNQTLDAAQ